MLVKAKEGQVSFLFQEQDPFFEIGFCILEQEQIPQMLPCQRRQQNGREKLIFQVDREKLSPLRDVEPGLQEPERIRLLCGMISLNMRVGENGFLKKECIWYRYDDLYYDKERGCIRAAILPVTGELRYADSGWFDRFEETVTRIAAGMPYTEMLYVKKIIQLMRMEKMTQEEVLADLRRLGGIETEDGTRVCRDRQDRALRLLYRGKDRELAFEVEGDDFLIGRSAGAVDGVIPVEYSRAVSRKHCLITKMNNKYFVQDLKSVNHTLGNGVMIPPYELTELENNDILSVADIEFRVTAG